MSREQWESLCDGCGKCCLIKELRGDKVSITRIGCRLLDPKTSCCSNYAKRRDIVHDCCQLDINNINVPGFLPDTCAYRLVADGKPLYWWHHLISGDRETVHTSGNSTRSMDIVNERRVSMTGLFKLGRIP